MSNSLANTCLLTGSVSAPNEKAERSNGQAMRKSEIGKKESCQLSLIFPVTWEDLTTTGSPPVHLTGGEPVVSPAALSAKVGYPE